MFKRRITVNLDTFYLSCKALAIQQNNTMIFWQLLTCNFFLWPQQGRSSLLQESQYLLKCIFNTLRFTSHICKHNKKANSFKKKKNLPQCCDQINSRKHYTKWKRLLPTAVKHIFKMQMVYSFNDERKILWKQHFQMNKISNPGYFLLHLVALHII